jgi:hypothetical protein
MEANTVGQQNTAEAGEPYRDIARRACSKDAVARHRAHIETAMVEAKKADDARDTDELLDELAELVRDARRLGREGRGYRRL